MENARIVPSLIEGSDAQYVRIQAYIRHDDSTLHIQGRGPSVNRPYGVSEDIKLVDLESGMTAWLDTIPKYHDSMAGTEKKYLILQMRHAESVNRLNFQVRYDPAYNTSYGGNFNVFADNYPALKLFWDRVMNPEKVKEPAVEVED